MQQDVVVLPPILVTDREQKPLPGNFHQEGFGTFIGEQPVGWHPDHYINTGLLNVPIPEYITEIDSTIDLARKKLAQRLAKLHEETHAEIETFIQRTTIVDQPNEINIISSRIEAINRLTHNIQGMRARKLAQSRQFSSNDPFSYTGHSLIDHLASNNELVARPFADAALLRWRNSLAAAEMAEYLSAKIAVLNEHKSDLSRRLGGLVSSTQPANPEGWRRQLNSVRHSVDTALGELPNFLRSQLVGRPAAESIEDPLAYITHFKAIAEAINASLPQSAMPSSDSIFTRPPLSVAELEAAYTLVISQRERKVSNQFTAAREAVLNIESKRLLSALAIKLDGLYEASTDSRQRLATYEAEQRLKAAEEARVTAEFERKRVEQEAADRAAEQAAAELAQRLAAAALQAAVAEEQERITRLLGQKGATSISIPLSSAAASVVATPQGSTVIAGQAYDHFVAAIRTVLPLLRTFTPAAARFVAGLIPGFLVGTLALLFPSNLGNSERRYALSLPLAELDDVDPDILAEASKTDSPVPLAFGLNLEKNEQGLTLSVIKATPTTPINARIINLQFNAATQAYAGTLEAPPRLITVTPAQAPGTQTASTEFPAMVPSPMDGTYAGNTLTVSNPAPGTEPGFQPLHAETYILTYPAESGIPPMYLALQKPPVEVLEVGEYAELSRRSVKDGLDIDHIPSRKALEYALRMKYRALSDARLRYISDRGVGIAIPQHVHRKFSETSGSRNTKDKQRLDGSDLRAAVESNFSALIPGLKEEGHSDESLQTALKKLHAENVKRGFYK